MASRDYKLGGAILAAAALHLLPVLPTTRVGQKARADISDVLHLNDRPVPPAPVPIPSKTRDELKARLASVSPPAPIEATDQEKNAAVSAFRESIRLNDGWFSEHVFRLYLLSGVRTPERTARVSRAQRKYEQWRTQLSSMLNQGVAIQVALPQVMAKMKYESAMRDVVEAIELERGNCAVAATVSMMLLADLGFTSRLYIRSEAASPYTNEGHVAPIFMFDDGYQWDIMAGNRSSGVGVQVPISYLPDLYAVQHDLPARRRHYRLEKVAGEDLFGNVVVPAHMYNHNGSVYFSGSLIHPYDPTLTTNTLRGDQFIPTGALFDARFTRDFTSPLVREGIDLPRNTRDESLIFFETPPLPGTAMPTITMHPLPTRVAGFAPSADLVELDTLASGEVTRLNLEHDPNRRLLVIARIVGLYRQIESNIHTQGYQDPDHLGMAAYAHTRAERYYADGIRLLQSCRDTGCIPRGMVVTDIQDLAHLGDEGLAFLRQLQTAYLASYPDYFQLYGSAAVQGVPMTDWINIVVTLLFSPSTRDVELATIAQLPIASQVSLCRYIMRGSLVSQGNRLRAFSVLLSDRQDTFARIFRVERSLAENYYFPGADNYNNMPPTEDYELLRARVLAVVQENNLPVETAEAFMTSLIDDRINVGITDSPTSSRPNVRRREIVNTIRAWKSAIIPNSPNAIYTDRVYREADLLLSRHQEMLQAWYEYQFTPPTDPHMINGHVEMDLRPAEVPGYHTWSEERGVQVDRFIRDYFARH